MIDASYSINFSHKLKRYITSSFPSPKVLILWFVAANMYYGVVLISTELLNSSSDTCGGAVSGLSSPNVTTGGAYDEEVECSLHKCRYSA